ncbi:MAG TPA: ATP citrate lyase citrate-binding domain-containing protein [Candidatus Nanoarchaeia archaeon]|nr:ATP citrate lyase citrate-binding domain-containing protein [Candidatus Nanoarchaeia archaeon]
MARQKIREFDAKKLLLENLQQEYQALLIDSHTTIENLPTQYPWLLQQKLVIKPDQLFGKRGKLGLVLLDADFQQVKEYLKQHLNREITIGKATDKLTHFLIEPFIAHQTEYYLSITSERDHDLINFSEAGGINVEENWHKVTKIEIPTLEKLNLEKIKASEKIKIFIQEVFTIFKQHHFSYLEFNPFTLDKNNNIVLLDTVAQMDSCGITMPFPKPFGRKSHPEEEHIAALDKESGASLKLTILNPQGRIWNILSGGGASIIYLDAIANSGKQEEIANYGEYSGNPTTEETYQYTKTILSAMTKEHHPQGKVLIIGGAIANFTDVEKTFIGIIKAFQEYQELLQKGKVSILVRRGGPNYEKGLKLMEQTGKELGLPIAVHGPETPMTKMVENIPGASS